MKLPTWITQLLCWHSYEATSGDRSMMPDEYSIKDFKFRKCGKEKTKLKLK